MNDRASEFFQSAYESFLARSRETTSAQNDFRLAETRARINVAGHSLGPIVARALSHLREPNEADVDLTISAWDTSDTKMISPAWSETDYGPRGEIRGFNDARFHTAFDHGTAALSMLDLETHRAIFWTRDATHLPAYESASPLRTIFSWWLQARGCLLVHAAAIARNNVGILLAGAGGSGKSTTALACLNAGFDYLADDYCALRVGDGPRVFSLYSSMKIAEQWLHSVPQFRELAALPGAVHEGKKIIFLNEQWPKRIRRDASCNLILLPRVMNQRENSVADATAAEALRALAPSSMFQTAAKGGSMFQQIAEFVQRVPARWLNLGRDIEAVPDLIVRCLEKMH